MKTTPETTTSIIASAFNKWADKLWFQILAVIVVLHLLITPIITPVINNYVQKQNMSETITNTLDTRDEQQRELHKLNFESSRQAYAMAKHKMSDYLAPTRSEYIFLIEYHNGAENVITGIQFCRFDLTIEVSTNVNEYVPVEKFRDDIVARYDILLSEDLSANKVQYYKYEDFNKVDKYLAHQLATINAQSYAIINLVDRDNKVFGSLMCVSTDDKTINIAEVHELARELEFIFNTNIYKK